MLPGVVFVFVGEINVTLTRGTLAPACLLFRETITCFTANGPNVRHIHFNGQLHKFGFSFVACLLLGRGPRSLLIE